MNRLTFKFSPVPVQQNRPDRSRLAPVPPSLDSSRPPHYCDAMQLFSETLTTSSWNSLKIQKLLCFSFWHFVSHLRIWTDFLIEILADLQDFLTLGMETINDLYIHHFEFGVINTNIKSSPLSYQPCLFYPCHGACYMLKVLLALLFLLSDINCK